MTSTVSPMPDRRTVVLVDPQCHGDDRRVLGADDHAADHEDLRVGEDADRRDQPRDREQDEPARWIPTAVSDAGFGLFPDRGEPQCPRRAGLSDRRSIGELGHDVLDDD